MIMDPVSTGPGRNATRLTRRGPAPGRFPGAETVWLSVVAGCASHMVGVAQLVEHRVAVAVVAGSGPHVYPTRCLRTSCTSEIPGSSAHSLNMRFVHCRPLPSTAP